MLPDFLGGALDTRDAIAVALHVQRCTACAQRRDELQPLFSFLDAQRARELAEGPGPDFLVAVNRKLDAPASRWSPGPLFVRFGIPAAAAATLLLLAVLTWPAFGPELRQRTRDAEMLALVETMDTTQLAMLADDLDAGSSTLGASADTFTALDEATPSDASAAPVFSELSFGELVAGSSTFLSSDDVLDIAAAAQSGTFPPSAQ
jgi:hypothetical protein